MSVSSLQPRGAATPSGAPIIQDDEEALDIARRIATDVARDAVDRDRSRRLPTREIEAIANSGLWAVTVPKAFGGAEVSYRTISRIIALISAADPSIGHILNNNYGFAQTLRTVGSKRQKEVFFARLLDGARFANAISEIGTKRAETYETRLSDRGDGTTRIDGRKFYCTGAMFAQYLLVVGFDRSDDVQAAIIDHDAPGLTIVDDWDGVGQRTTASGTVIVDGVIVPNDRILAMGLARDLAPQGAIAQLIHASIDAGIARAALDDTLDYVRTKTRPWRGTGVEHGYEDPYIIAEIGNLETRLAAGEALLERSGRVIDDALARPSEAASALASIVTAQAKILTTEAALLATNKLFQLAGAGSTQAKYSFDRHWRNARTHTVHDPLHWKFNAIGNYVLNGINPHRKGAL